MHRNLRKQVIAALLRANRPDLANVVAEVAIAKLSFKEALEMLSLDGNDLSPETLKNAYRKAAMTHHPDRGGDLAQMKLVNEAHDLLSKFKGQAPSSRIDNTDKYKAAAATVREVLAATFAPTVFTRHLETCTGKTLKMSHKDKSSTHSTYRSAVSYETEWRSDDDMTVFTLHVHVSLSNVVFGPKSLGTGDADLSFPIMVSTSIFHNNRKVKFKPRTWESTSHHRIIADPNELFPKDKIKKMIGGKENARKFSKRDMELGLKSRLHAEIDSRGGQTWAFIPIGECKFVIYRSTMMGMATWSSHHVAGGVENGKRVKADTKFISVLESEALIEVLVDIQKRGASQDVRQIASLVNTEFSELSRKMAEG
jgi:hypothetical protein